MGAASRSTPAQGRRGKATDLFVKMLGGEYGMLCVALGSPHQLPAGWFHDADLTGALWHQNPVAMKDNVQEDQMRHGLPGN